MVWIIVLLDQPTIFRRVSTHFSHHCIYLRSVLSMMEQNGSHTITLSPPRFTVGTVFSGLKASHFPHQTKATSQGYLHQRTDLQNSFPRFRCSQTKFSHLDPICHGDDKPTARHQLMMGYVVGVISIK